MKKLILLLMFVMMFSLVGAVKPTQIIDSGCEIRNPVVEMGQVNTTVQAHIHVINTSLRSNDALLPSNSECYVHLYNSTGSHIFEANAGADSNGLEFALEIQGGNFSQQGTYPFYIQCNSSATICASSGGIEITSSGLELTTPKSILFIGFLGILIFIFIITIFGIGMLPSANTKDEDGKIMNISYMKYFRNVLYMFEWGLIIAILYLVSNISFAYLGAEMFAQFFLTLFKLSYGVTPIIVIVWGCWLLYQAFEDKRIKQLFERGIFPQGNKF